MKQRQRRYHHELNNDVSSTLPITNNNNLYEDYIKQPSSSSSSSSKRKMKNNKNSANRNRGYYALCFFILTIILLWIRPNQTWHHRKNHDNRNNIESVSFLQRFKQQRKMYNYYIPTLNNDTTTDTLLSSSTPPYNNVLHIIKTRFMQEQGNLLHLGMARLELFITFCLPTIINQSIQNFIWIIKIDPNLHPSILYPLIDVISSSTTNNDNYNNNIYVVASNNNYRINENFPGSWRDGIEIKDIEQSKVYTGNRTLLEDYMKYSQLLHVLETRLDADDGLHTQFIETVQNKALQQFNSNNNIQWMYWCSRRHMEWHWMDPLISNHELQKTIPSMSLIDMIKTYGTLQGITHEKLCVTPGITTGFAIGTKEQDIPIFAHDELAKKIKFPKNHDNNNKIHCGLSKSTDCLQFVDNFIFEAIRSRSPTSAGMLKIHVNNNEYIKQWYINYRFWNVLYESFHISRIQLKFINQYLTEHIIDVANDNLLGQCTTGHSCKDSAKMDLEKLIKSRNVSITS